MEDIVKIPPAFDVLTGELIDLMDTSDSNDGICVNRSQELIIDDLQGIIWNTTDQLQVTPATHTPLPMQVDDIIPDLEKIVLDEVTPNSASKDRSKGNTDADLVFPLPSPPKNPFLPDPISIALDLESIKYSTEIGENGRLITKKALKHPAKTLKGIIEKEKSESINDKESIHTFKEHTMTYDAYVKIKDFTDYVTAEDKRAYIELRTRNIIGFIKVDINKVDEEIVVQMKYYSGMIRMVKLFNARHQHTSLRLRPKVYYTIEGQRVSSRQFKILDVPAELAQETIESSIRKLMNGKPFHIRPHNGIKKQNKDDSKVTIFFTAKDEQARNILKQIWSIEIDNNIYRLAPAHYGKDEFEKRKTYTGRFRGFDRSHTPSKIMEVLTIHNPMNAYKGHSANEFFAEFQHEHDLFNACEGTMYFSNFKITGLPKGYNWHERNDFLAKYCKKKQSGNKGLKVDDQSSNKENINYPNLCTQESKNAYQAYKCSFANPKVFPSATRSNRIPLGPNKRLTHNTSPKLTRAKISLSKTSSNTSHHISASDVTSLTSHAQNIVESADENVNGLC